MYEVLTPDATLTPRGKAMFRVDADSSGERVEVFHGSVDVASSLGSWTLAKDSVLESESRKRPACTAFGRDHPGRLGPLGAGSRNRAGSRPQRPIAETYSNYEQ